MEDGTLTPIGVPPGIVDQIVEQVREKIIDGTFSPGAHVADATVATQMHVSRGPVREALQRLIQEGLLYSVRNRGAFVAELEASDIEDIALARLAVDRLAAGHLAKSRNPEALAALNAIVAEMRVVAGADNWKALIELDLRFHEVLVGSLESRRLRNFYQTLMVETRISLSQLRKYYPDQYEIADEHQLLLDAMARNDSAELDDVVAKHLDHAGRRAEFEAARQAGL